MSDEGKIKSTIGIGGPVVKEAIAQAPATRWYIQVRDFGVWHDIAPDFATEAEALTRLTELKNNAHPNTLEAIVLNRA